MKIYWTRWVTGQSYGRNTSKREDGVVGSISSATERRAEGRAGQGWAGAHPQIHPASLKSGRMRVVRAMFKEIMAGSFFFLIYCIDYAITVVLFPPPFIPLHPAHPLPPAFPYLSSCPWVVHISSLASPIPILFLTSPYFVPTNYASYSLYHFPCSSPSPYPLTALQMISISMILFLF